MALAQTLVASMAPRPHEGERIKGKIRSIPASHPARRKLNAGLLNFPVFTDSHKAWEPSGSGPSVRSPSVRFCSKSSLIGLCDIAVSQFPILFLSSSKNREINIVSSVFYCDLV